ncbi:MAG: pyridoxamine kinase [Dehalococcoidales bacterium]|nr:pyridoxamine kinase [Dehalococcoidales bacterium]
MDTKRILTIQDISCVGQCSLTVALPIISACGVETCILPSAVLSTHTAGFTGFTVRDLADDMPAIEKHWVKEGIFFDAVYTGYLGSKEQIDYVSSIIKNTCKGPAIIDPAMADNGKLYPAFDMAYVDEMKKLCFNADIVLPNITEACFLTGIKYKEVYDESYVKNIVNALLNSGAKAVVLTGVGYTPDTTGVVCATKNSYYYYRHHRYAKSCHGTGDVYASAFVGAYMNGRSMEDASRIAADFTVKCMENTLDDASHWYGVKFEPILKQLSKMID